MQYQPTNVWYAYTCQGLRKRIRRKYICANSNRVSRSTTNGRVSPSRRCDVNLSLRNVSCVHYANSVALKDTNLTSRAVIGAPPINSHSLYQQPSPSGVALQADIHTTNRYTKPQHKQPRPVIKLNTARPRRPPPAK